MKHAIELLEWHLELKKKAVKMIKEQNPKTFENLITEEESKIYSITKALDCLKTSEGHSIF